MRDKGIKGIILPRENAAEAAVVEGIDIMAVDSLTQIVEFLSGTTDIIPTKIDLKEVFDQSSNYGIDFHEVKGQEHAKHSLEVAAAGGNNIFMIGFTVTQRKNAHARRCIYRDTDRRFPSPYWIESIFT